VLDEEKERARIELALKDSPYRKALPATPGALPATPGLRTQNAVEKRAGRRPTRNTDFDTLAGNLWSGKKTDSKRVTSEGLKYIAEQLDASPFTKPSDYLEGNAARVLKDHNKKFGHSPANQVQTWLALLERGDKDQVGAMRRLLSRCAGNIRK